MQAQAAGEQALLVPELEAPADEAVVQLRKCAACALQKSQPGKIAV